MSGKGEQADLFGSQSLEFEIDGVILPDDHSVFKLFPGQTYRLAKAMRETNFVFLDILGLDSLEGASDTWSDDALLSLISLDRVMRSGSPERARKRKRGGSEQDKKRLGFLKALFFTAKRGDLVLVPLGEGFAGQIAVGEVLDEPGRVDKLSYVDGDETLTTYGRRVKWITDLHRYNLSPKLVKSIHSPTALHLIGASYHEEVYIGVYGTFAYQGVYVAKFPSTKETLGAQDYANIGVLFNGLAVAHDGNVETRTPTASPDTFYELAIERDGSATIEFQRNSPISAIVRTLGPLAFTAAVMFSGAAEGASLRDLQHVTVIARPVGNAHDRCHFEVPPDMAVAAVGLGADRYKTFCSVRKKVEDEALVKSPAHLKKRHRKAK